MKHIILSAAILLVASPSFAQERTMALWGHVKDSFTKVGVPGTKITLMRTDSTMIDTTRVWKNPQPGASYDATYRFTIPAKPGRFIVKAEHPDYEDTYINYSVSRVARNTYFDMPWHYMKRREVQESSMDKTMGEVTVKATRVQMYYKGDTIVFNADAFTVPEGSMLDAIIRQLPNTELREGGQIFVNGRKIDNLTLNGKDFFKGNNQVMLNNLPYYTVKQIRVFDEDTERSKWLGRTVEKKEYTMDVQLKREYSIGWITNYTAGGGIHTPPQPSPQGEGAKKSPSTNAYVYKSNNPTPSHCGEGRGGVFLGRLFALRFSENSRFTAFANANNISEDATGHGDGEWRVNSDNSGQQRFINGGLNWTVNDPDNKLSNEMNLTARHQRQNLETRTLSESYLTTGNTFGRNLSESRSKNLRVNFNDRFFLKVPFRWVSNLQGSFSQSLRNSHGTALTAADQALGDTVNFTSNRGDVTSCALNMSWDHDFDFKLSTGDVFHFNVNAAYGRTTNETYSQNDYRYRHTPQNNAFYNRFDDTPTHDYKLNGEIRYELNWQNGFSIRFFANGHYNAATENADYHRLDLLENLWNMQGGHEFGTLPQSQDSLRMALDLANSYHARQHEWEARGGTVAGYSKTAGKTHIFAEAWLPVRRTWMTMDYTPAQAEVLTARHNYTYFSPYISATMARDNYQKYLTLTLHKTETVAPMMSRIDRRSDTNPLAVQTGNPNLKDAHNYTASFFMQLRSNAKAQSMHFRSSYSTTKDAIGQGFEYDPATGRRTYRPMNIDGNWQTSNQIGVGKTFGKKRRWSADASASHNFIRTRDLASIVGQEGSGMSTVRNHIVGTTAYLRYRVEKFNVMLYGHYDWRRILRQGEAGQSLQGWNYRLQANATALPWDMSASTSLGMYSRRGYSSSDLNDNNLVWDASLTKTFCKGHLTAILKGHDLLGQLSNVSYTVNAQGRTETWTNTLTRYIMLSLQYKFSKMPKKK